MEKKSINNTRDFNRKQIIKYILLNGPNVSQSEICQELNLNNSTIKRICDTLIADNILIEDNIILATKGRRPKIYSINPEFKQMLVLVIGTHQTQFFYYNLNLTVKEQYIIKYDASISFNAKLLLIINSISNTDFDFCMIITSGTIDNTNKILVNSTRFNIQNFPIADFFASKLNVPVFVENNMNAAAIFHLNRNLNPNQPNDFVLISSHKGLGSGFIINNQIYRGSTGSAGEIGHQFYQTSTEQCYCKRFGCFELFLSTNLFQRNDVYINKIEDFHALQKTNSALHLQLLTDLAQTAAHLIRNLENTLNIQNIYLSGLIFEILYHPDNINAFNEQKQLNLIESNLNLITINEEFFHVGGAIIAAKLLLEL